MIEVFNAKRTRSFGCFASFRSAVNTLTLLASEGSLGAVPSVFVAAYRNGVLQREYEAVYAAGKWRVPKERKQTSAKIVQMPVPEYARKPRKRKLCKDYLSADLMFREAFPEWTNRTYPLSAKTMQLCYLKHCRGNHGKSSASIFQNHKPQNIYA